MNVKSNGDLKNIYNAVPKLMKVKYLNVEYHYKIYKKFIYVKDNNMGEGKIFKCSECVIMNVKQIVI